MRFDTADRITAAILFLVGLAMLYGSFVMDRLEIRQIHPASIPGLVPMFLGAALMLCAILLFTSSRPPDPDVAGDTGSTRDLLLAAGLSVFYAVVLVGRVPFVVATAVYIAAFILLFATGDPSRRVRRAVFAVVFAALFAAAVGALFRFAFLVRLP